MRYRSVNSVTEAIRFLEKLSNAFGPSGSEEDVAELLKRELAAQADETRVDKLGNILFYHNGKKGYRAR